MFALCDCNNFYASCERVFKPKLNNKPVVVLSNNDGCVIARSQEAKDLGVAMGVPAFEIKELIKQHNINVFSSNYTLYGDFSSRVMNVLGEYAPNYEVYSIDEIFLNFTEFKNQDLAAYCRTIRKAVKQETKIPISIGIAATKTLAKMANKIAKKKFKEEGVLHIKNTEEAEKYMKEFPVGDLWGIGRQNEKKLIKHNITTAYQLSIQDDTWIRKNFTVQGLKLVMELRGISCIPLEEVAPDKKGMCVSRSFGSMVSDLNILEESVATFANMAAEKLRKQKSICSVITVFIHTNQFRTDLKQYYRSQVVQLPLPTNNSSEIIEQALIGLRKIYRKDYFYKKAGILINDISPEGIVQTNLFEDKAIDEKKLALNSTVDLINKSMGGNVLKYAVMGDGKKWKLKQEMKSPCYTTRLSDVLTIKI